MRKRFAELDYSGDVGIEGWADSREELIEAMTEGLLALMTHTPPESVVERTIEIEAASDEDLLVDWLSEVISTAATRGEIYGSVNVSHADDSGVTGTLRGSVADPGAHELRFDVKAATYHGLLFERDQTGFHARVIFDL